MAGVVDDPGVDIQRRHCVGEMDDRGMWEGHPAVQKWDGRTVPSSHSVRKGLFQPSIAVLKAHDDSADSCFESDLIWPVVVVPWIRTTLKGVLDLLLFLFHVVFQFFLAQIPSRKPSSQFILYALSKDGIVQLHLIPPSNYHVVIAGIVITIGESQFICDRSIRGVLLIHVEIPETRISNILVARTPGGYLTQKLIIL